jgi:hypothetical protein
MPLTRTTPSSVEVIQVIKVVANRGAGLIDDPIRNVTQFWSFDGRLLAEDDPNANLTTPAKAGQGG